MADERKNPRKWSLEEIDELLQDSGLMPRGGDALEYVEVTPDGYIVGLKDTNNTPVKVTATFSAASTAITGGNSRVLEVHVVTDGRASG